MITPGRTSTAQTAQLNYLAMGTKPPHCLRAKPSCLTFLGTCAPSWVQCSKHQPRVTTGSHSRYLVSKSQLVLLLPKTDIHCPEDPSLLLSSSESLLFVNFYLILARLFIPLFDASHQQHISQRQMECHLSLYTSTSSPFPRFYFFTLHFAFGLPIVSFYSFSKYQVPTMG